MSPVAARQRVLYNIHFWKYIKFQFHEKKNFDGKTSSGISTTLLTTFPS